MAAYSTRTPPRAQARLVRREEAAGEDREGGGADGIAVGGGPAEDAGRVGDLEGEEAVGEVVAPVDGEEAEGRVGEGAAGEGGGEEGDEERPDYTKVESDVEDAKEGKYFDGEEKKEEQHAETENGGFTVNI